MMDNWVRWIKSSSISNFLSTEPIWIMLSQLGIAIEYRRGAGPKTICDVTARVLVANRVEVWPPFCEPSTKQHAIRN